jgi:serine/threonine protein kinase/tetratricopeptide (TPR) repeat protein
VSDPLNEPPPEVTVETGERPGQPPTFKPGDRLGRYVILSLLGQGGMAVVFLAYDPELDRKVAVKLVRAGLLGTQGRSRLQREAQALARLSHPNVVPVYDVGTVNDQTFVAMEHVDGVTLKKWLKQPRTFREIRAVMLDAGRGLSAAHRAGLVHRDFKPDNVIIGNDGRVRVLDFGLARAVEDLSTSNPSELRTPSGEDPRSPSSSSPGMEPEHTFSDEPSDSSQSGRRRLSQVTRADQIIGTPAYMAPEQNLGGVTDERADQFSFCVTLYEAFWRAKPFDRSETLSGSRMPTIAEKKKKGHKPRALASPPPKPKPGGPQVPRFVEAIVMRGLSMDPVDRWPSMDQLLQALSRDPAQRRRRWLIGAGAVAMLAAGVVSAVTLRQRERALCRGGEEQMARVWGAGAREQVRTAFAGLRLPYADSAAATFTHALDEYATSWTQMRRDACEATRLRGEQSEEVLDLRMACLSDRLKEVSALSDVMRHPDADAVQEASRATTALTPVAECADIAALKGAQPRPRDPAQRKRIDELQRRLAEVQAQYAVGKDSEAAKLSDSLVADARVAGWAPLTAEALLWRGRAAADLGDEKSSIPAYRDAFAVALGGHNDRVMRQASTRLAQEYIYKNDLGEYRYWETLSQAAIDRTGPDPRMESFLQHVHCIALWQSGKVGERLECLKKHAAKAERLQPLGEWELTTLGLAASDAGRYQEAIDYLQRGVDYSMKANGFTHPRTLEMRGYLCKGYINVGDYDRALAECRAALKTIKDVAPDNKFLSSKIELYLGETLRRIKQYGEARSLIEDATPNVKTEGGEALLEMAQLESSTGHHAAALSFFQKSLVEDEKELGPDHPNLVTDLHYLGDAFLKQGNLVQAQKYLERAHKIAEHADLSPLQVADVDFTYAQAMAAADPARRAEAVKLAEKARASYAKSPRYFKLDQDLARFDKWIANPTAPLKD